MDDINHRKSAKARDIAQAALRLFSRKGYPLTSIGQIAAEAGIGKSTVYEYYATKEALFEAAVAEAADDWIAGMASIGRESDDAETRLRMLGALFAEHHDPVNNPEQGLFVEVLSQTLRQGGVFCDRPDMIRQIYRRIVRIVVNYLLEGISRGQLRPEIAQDAETIAIHYLASLDGILLHGMIAPGQAVPKVQVAFFLDQLIPTLLAAPEKRAAEPNAQS